MRWRGRRESDNVEDRRGQRRSGFPFPFPGRNGPGLPFPGRGRSKVGGLGIWGILIALGLMFIFGIDPRVILQNGGNTGGLPKIDIPQMPNIDATRQGQNQRQGFPFPGQSQTQNNSTSQDDDLKRFISVVLADTEDLWKRSFRRNNRNYREPKLVLFTGFVQSACGAGQSAMGPFYCPLDQKIYIDLSFYRELKNKFQAPGDFAQAYVIAHEVGHHVQTLLGISKKVQQAKARASRKDQNRIQVMMELQADCLAGIWAHYTDKEKNVLDPGDIEEALRAASAIGDDRIQKRSQGYVVPDSFTHGSAAQRVRWFKRGYESGSMRQCDTFRAERL